MTTYTYSQLVGLLEYSGDCNTNLRLVLAYLDPDNSNSYDNWTLYEHVVEETEIHCACSHEIQNNFKIIHKTTGDMVIIGSSCVSKFSTEMRIAVGRHVRRLNDNTGAKYCSAPDCNKKINQSVVIQYPTQEKHYHKSCLDKVFKKCRNCKCYKTYDCDCEKRMIEKEKRAREMRIEREKENEKRVKERTQEDKRIKEMIERMRIESEKNDQESQREREIESERIEKESQREREIEQEKRIQEKIEKAMREKLMLENARIAHVMLEKSRLSQSVRKCIEENCTNELKDPKNPDVRCVSCLYKPKYREKAQRNKLQKNRT